MADWSYVPKEVISLVGLIDTYKRWKHFKYHKDRKYEHYHPSEFGKCLRTQQYKHYVELGLIKVPFNEIDSKSLRLFDKGHNMHVRWINYFDDIGGILRGRWRCKNILCYLFNDNKERGKFSFDNLYKNKASRIYGDKEKCGIFKPDKCICGCTEFKYLENKVKDIELNMAGQADFVLDCSNLIEDRFNGVRNTFDPRFLPVNGKKIVGDMKTIGSNGWSFQLEKKGPHKSYLIQLTIYIHILGCDYGFLIYENKDNSELKCFKVDRNEEWWKIIKWQAQTMINMVKERKLPPPRSKSKSDWDCKRCDFKILCHKSKVWKDPNFDKKRKSFYKELL